MDVLLAATQPRIGIKCVRAGSEVNGPGRTPPPRQCLVAAFACCAGRLASPPWTIRVCLRGARTRWYRWYSGRTALCVMS